MRNAGLFIVLILVFGLRGGVAPAADVEPALQVNVQLWKFADTAIEVILDDKVVYSDRDPEGEKVTTGGPEHDAGPTKALKTIAAKATESGAEHTLVVRLLDKDQQCRLVWDASEQMPWIVIRYNERKGEFKEPPTVTFKLQGAAAAKK